MTKISKIGLAMILPIALSNAVIASGNGHGQECFRECIVLDPNDRWPGGGKDSHEDCEISCQVSMPRSNMQIHLYHFKPKHIGHKKGKTQLSQKVRSLRYNK